MRYNRRKFLGSAAVVAAANLAGAASVRSSDLPDAIIKLKPMTGGIKPISDNERRARIEKARKIMAEDRLDAILLEPGSSLFYFTGIRWNRSERTFGVILPARGELAYVVPGFEEMRARELIRFGNDIRIWQEDESPYRKIVQVLKDRGISTGRVGIEESVRFFIFDGIRKEVPAIEYASADPVTAGCRVIKSPAEIALMQCANDITVAAFRAALSTLREGMTQHDLRDNCVAAFRALGVEGSVLASFGKYTAFPHGSVQPQKLKEGDVVLMDGGCSVEGYQSDVTRTLVYGKPSPRQREVWNLERKAQDTALAAAQVGATCDSVDAAARKVITDAGFGPDYRVPGLPHRTGHGIGLDGHEWTNLVRGNKTRIQPGMCFSDEPMIAIYGEFGVRLEDCMYITLNGAKMFTRQSPSIERPFV